MKLGRWSTAAGSNNAATPDGWPEGQAPSTLNDCAREMMASIRTVFNDAQFFDQDLTPTQASVTSFTVPGDQTSAIHAGRRLKLFDASTMYATVTTASFTAVTTIHVVTDSGSNLTTSLSSFAIALLSNKGFPQGLSISAAAVAAVNTAKAWVRFTGTAAGTVATVNASHNVSSVSRSGVGVYKINFTVPMSNADYTFAHSIGNNGISLNYIGTSQSSFGVSTFKFSTINLVFTPAAAVVADVTITSGIHLVFHDT